MKLNNGALVLKGVFEIEHRAADGSLKERFTIDNTITNTGKALVASLISNQATAGFKRIALDASGTAATASNTALASEITSPSLKRVSATASKVTTTQTNDTSQLLHTFTSTATQAVMGVGVFDTPTSGGNMLSRVTFASKNLTNGDTLQVTHKVIVA